ncbi:light-harvesting complex-like protein OHP2, chloroplastic [Rutidosis leptorrhynchoides]|uniref:light-harvesting complex-like protein OHP2, chloroplastic n=1 Tax=Rutidosis leptorrhynchoides TaxID=125765 RepID=UPI003A995C5D
MSVASIQCIRITNSSSNPFNSSITASKFCFSSTNPSLITIKCTQSDNSPLRRPSIATPPVKPTPASPPPSPVSPSLPVTPQPAVVAAGHNVVTMEFQRQKAKEIQQYFKQKKLEESNQGPFFGFIAKNEISNGRWAMFGFAVGMLTEYATGSDFVDQVKILLSNFGILDLE